MVKTHFAALSTFGWVWVASPKPNFPPNAQYTWKATNTATHTNAP
jgi:hypothetical protein